MAELLGVNPSLAPTVIKNDPSKQELDLKITGNKIKTTPTTTPSSNHGSGDEKTTEEPGSEVSTLVNGTTEGDNGENTTVPAEPLSDLDFISSQSSQ